MNGLRICARISVVLVAARPIFYVPLACEQSLELKSKEDLGMVLRESGELATLGVGLGVSLASGVACAVRSMSFGLIPAIRLHCSFRLTRDPPLPCTSPKRLPR